MLVSHYSMSSILFYFPFLLNAWKQYCSSREFGEANLTSILTVFRPGFLFSTTGVFGEGGGGGAPPSVTPRT